MVLVSAYPLSAHQLLPQSFYLLEGQVQCSSEMKTSALVLPEPNFVIRYDLRDTGRSTTCEPGTASYTLRGFANDALGVLDAFGLKKAHFVGFSLGGGVSQLIAIENPDRIAAMTLARRCI